MTKILLTAKDGSTATLSAGISAVALSIPLALGKGALFPQPYNGSATSGGSATALNCTGISAAIGGAGAVGKFIYNATDGSWCKIVTVNTNDLVTTRLNGGTTNLWNNADKWYIDPFIGTLAVVSTSAYGVKTVTASERVLIIGRSTDTLTVATGGRGYDGTTGQTFSLGDSFYLNVNAATMNNVQEVILSTQTQIDTNLTALNTLTTRVGALETGSYFYVVATGSSNAFVVATPAFAALAAGNVVTFKANFSITGATTINVNGLGAKAIKKLDGATALVTGDIYNGQIVEVVYDGTNFQMISPIGQVPATVPATVYENYTLDEHQLTASETYALLAQYTVPATMGVGTTIIARWHGTFNNNDTAARFNFRLGTTMTAVNIISGQNSVQYNAYTIELKITVLTTGGSGSIIYDCNTYYNGVAARTVSTTATTIDTTTTNLLKIQVVGGGGGDDPHVRNYFCNIIRYN